MRRCKIADKKSANCEGCLYTILHPRRKLSDKLIHNHVQVKIKVSCINKITRSPSKRKFSNLVYSQIYFESKLYIKRINSFKIFLNDQKTVYEEERLICANRTTMYVSTKVSSFIEETVLFFKIISVI